MGGPQRRPDEQLKGAVSVTLQDLQWALSAVKPSAMREVAVDVPKVTAPLTLAGALPVAPGFGVALVHSRSPETLPSKLPWMKRGEKRSRMQLFWVRA